MCWSLAPWMKRFLGPLDWGTGPDCCYPYALYSSSEYSPFLESLEKVLESAPTGDSIIPPGEFNTHVANDSETWRGVTGRNGMPNLNPSGVQLLDPQSHQHAF